MVTSNSNAMTTARCSEVFHGGPETSLMSASVRGMITNPRKRGNMIVLKASSNSMRQTPTTSTVDPVLMRFMVVRSGNDMSTLTVLSPHLRTKESPLSESSPRTMPRIRMSVPCNRELTFPGPFSVVKSWSPSMSKGVSVSFAVAPSTFTSASQKRAPKWMICTNPTTAMWLPTGGRRSPGARFTSTWRCRMSEERMNILSRRVARTVPSHRILCGNPPVTKRLGTENGSGGGGRRIMRGLPAIM